MTQPLHASAFSYQGAGCLLLGESGVGKTTLLSKALLYGAQLIGDDQLQLEAVGGALFAAPAANLQGVLELHGLGLIRYPSDGQPQRLHLAIEINPYKEAERLPALQSRTFCGITIPAHVVQRPPEIAPLLLYVSAVQESRLLPEDWFASG